MWGLLTLWIRGWADFRALNVQDRLKMIQGTFLATLARLFCVPPIRRDRGLNSRIVSCLSSASVIAVPYAISCYSALRYTSTDCMEFWKLFLSSMIRNSIKNLPLQWRHNERDGVSNNQPHDCLLNRLRRRSTKTSKLRATGNCEVNSPVIVEFPAHRASNAESVSIWWRHHASGHSFTNDSDVYER